MKIIYISSGGGDNPWLQDLTAEFMDQGYNLNIIQGLSESLDIEEKIFMEFLKEGEDCDLLIVQNHGSSTYFKKWNRFFSFLKDKNIPSFILSSIPDEMRDYRRYFPFSDDAYNLRPYAWALHRV